jgi:hypothetical protein
MQKVQEEQERCIRLSTLLDSDCDSDSKKTTGKAVPALATPNGALTAKSHVLFKIPCRSPALSFLFPFHPRNISLHLYFGLAIHLIGPISICTNYHQHSCSLRRGSDRHVEPAPTIRKSRHNCIPYFHLVLL